MAIPATVLAALLRGGIAIRVAGIEVQDGRGEPASALRCSIRALVAWSPALFLMLMTPIWLAMRPDGGTVAILSTAASVAAGTFGIAYAIAHPTRGLQDRIAGTYLVPR
jgi:hypothetical protein